MAALGTGFHLNDPVTAHLRQDVTRLVQGQTVGEALAWLRAHPPAGRILYLYVVDENERLCGVVPTRRLLLSAPEAPLADIMIRQLITLPARASVSDACEFFVQYRLLAFPVVDEERRLLGVVDIDLYTDELGRLSEISPIERWLQPVVRFLQVESASGLLLTAATLAALVLANSPWAAAFDALWHVPVNLAVGGLALNESLHFWINDGLMTLFFFVVGLEIKREVVDGELSDLRNAALPVVAALGGMLAPAAVYLALQAGRPTAHGWGIPMATDIAFVVGFLALLGPRVPHGLKVLLLTLAIADDVGAVLVIALVYSTDLSLPALAAGLGGFGMVALLRWVGVRQVPVYAVVGALIWLAFVKSGVHPTVAGVGLGLLTPARPWLGDRVPFDLVGDLFRRLARQVGQLERREAISPLERLEQNLHPWVAFGIMPLFALANAGVPLDPARLLNPLALAVAAGLILGKPLGIVVFSWASVKAGLARLPEGMDMKTLIGAGCLAGIGFTMSLFIAGLALRGPHLDEAKIGIVFGSSVSAVLGCVLLRSFLPQGPSLPVARHSPLNAER